MQRAVVSLVLALVGGSGCAVATGHIEGGEPLEGGTLPPEGPHDADVNPCLDGGGRGTGSTFSDLYRDFFGPKGQASCSAQSICHVPGGTGARSTNYQCAPDQAMCWSTMTSTIVPDGGSSSPEMTTLYKALRKAPPATGSGPMPRGSLFAFCPADMERIAAWIKAGAKND